METLLIFLLVFGILLTMFGLISDSSGAVAIGLLMTIFSLGGVKYYSNFDQTKIEYIEIDHINRADFVTHVVNYSNNIVINSSNAAFYVKTNMPLIIEKSIDYDRIGDIMTNRIELVEANKGSE